MTKITEKTLIPLSLVISIVGGVFWLTTMWADTQANARTIEKIEFKQEKFSRAVVDKLDDIKDRLARIEERQNVTGSTLTRREKIRKGLNPIYLDYYNALCWLMPDSWQPVSGLRSFEEQAALYAKGRTLPGSIVTNAVPGRSPHNYGCATDWCMFVSGEPVWEHNEWHVYHAALERVGLKWGGDFVTFKDKPHNELNINIAWKELTQPYTEGGFEAVNKIILANLKKEGE